MCQETSTRTSLFLFNRVNKVDGEVVTSDVVRLLRLFSYPPLQVSGTKRIAFFAI